MLKLARFSLFTYTVLLITLCLIDVGSINIKPILAFDKFLHVGAYFTLGFISYFTCQTQKQYAALLVAGFCLGIAVEIAQATLTQYRGADFADQIANTFGLLLSYQVCRVPFIKNRWPLKKLQATAN